jgi:16S rRNA (cytosine1402-N4)-methyltransferase
MVQGMTATPPHRPVLLKEVLAALRPMDGAIYVDATFGAGGYSRAILEAANCVVFAIDRDPAAIGEGEDLAVEFAGRLHLIQGRFGDMQALLAGRGVKRVQGVAIDLGVSSMQIDRAQRGFSFRLVGPLDMRMEAQGESAADIVNHMAERPLADLIFTFGEERRARRVAKAIVAARALAPIATTERLAEIVRRAVGPSADRIDPATRTFQALRIAVNDELGEIDRGLAAAESLLAPGGRLAVVSFHSLEDRRIKSFMRQCAGKIPGVSRHAPATPKGREASLRLLGREAIRPTAEEIAANPRARSAKLRVAERLGEGGAA